MVINPKTNRIAVIDPLGNLTEIKRDAKSEGGLLKDGWSYATHDDLQHAADIEAERAAKEAAEAAAATVAELAAQAETDKRESEVGGPFGAA